MPLKTGLPKKNDQLLAPTASMKYSWTQYICIFVSEDKGTLSNVSETGGKNYKEEIYFKIKVKWKLPNIYQKPKQKEKASYF